MNSSNQKNYLQILNYFDTPAFARNTLIYGTLLSRISGWDKSLMSNNRFDYVSNIHLRTFKPFLGVINLQFLDSIECIDIPYYDFFVANEPSGNYGFIGKIFDSTKDWNIMYFCDELLCRLNVFPSQKLLEIWIVKSIIDDQVNNNIENINTVEIQERLENYLTNHSWCHFFFRGFSRPIILKSNNLNCPVIAGDLTSFSNKI